MVTTYKHSHITLSGVDPVCDGLNGHPPDWQTPVRGLDVYVVLPGQTEVRYLQSLVLPNQYVPAGQISVDNPLTGQVCLRTYI